MQCDHRAKRRGNVCMQELRETLDHTRVVGQRSCLVLRLRLTVGCIGLPRARSQVLQDVDLRLVKMPR
jgi:hypothetical protein